MGPSIGWSVGWSVGRSVGRSVSQSVGRSVRWSVCLRILQYSMVLNSQLLSSMLWFGGLGDLVIGGFCDWGIGGLGAGTLITFINVN